MAFLREIPGGRRISVEPKVTLIGRHPTCDVVVPLGEVSGRHAMIVRADGDYCVEDLGSRNGTFVNGNRINQRTRLAPGDCLEIPGLVVEFHEDEPGTTSPAPPAGPPGDESAATIVSSLDVAAGPRAGVAPEAKLRAVLELSRTLGNALALEDVLPKILESLFSVFPQADRGFILLRDDATGELVPKASRCRGGRDDSPPAISRTVVSHALATGRAVLSTDAALDRRFLPSQSVRDLRLRSVMCVPMISQTGAALGVIQIDTAGRENVFWQDDLDVLLCAGMQAGRAVELACLHEERRDLEAATGIQQNFLPDRRPRVEGLQFFDHYSPALQVGGDYYDYIALPGDHLAVVLGDVAGKGVSAALLMARLSADARFCLATAPTVPQAVRQLNAALARAVGDDRFITFLVAVLDLARHALTVVNAGHPPPLRRRPGLGVEALGEEAVGLPLAGIDRPYEETVVALEPGDRLVLYTDGVTEALNPAGEIYGPERLRAAVQQAPDAVEPLGATILADVRRFSAGRAQRDDLTLVCFGRDR